MLDQTGARDGPPALCNLQIADLLGGAASAAIALLAALVGAQRTGRGRYVDVAMADASLAHNIFALHALEQWGRALPRGEDLLTGGVPCYGVYPTQDGRWLAVGALEDKFWQRAVRDDRAARSRRRPVRAGRRRRARARASSSAIFAARAARGTGSSDFADVDCCVTPVATLDEALADPQFAARDMVRRARRRLARVRAAVQALRPRVRGDARRRRRRASTAPRSCARRATTTRRSTRCVARRRASGLS